MRNDSPLFWPETTIDQGLRSSMQRNYSDCINILETQWYQADLDQRFVLGDQDIWGLIFPGVATYRRKIFNFNIINAIIQAISGQQRQTRKSSICIPMNGMTQKTADQLTKALYYVHSHNGSLYHTYSDAFEKGALTSGLGFVKFDMDYSKDPVSGEIVYRYVDMKSCLFDPYFRRHDFSDARFWWSRQFFDRVEASILYPRFADEILSLPKGTYRDDKFYYMPEVYQIQFPNLIAFDEYWYQSSRKCEYLVDVETEETQEFFGDEEDAREIYRQFGKRLKIIEGTKPTVRRTIVLNDRVMVDEADPYGLDRYPIACSLAYFQPDTAYYAYKFRGVTRDMRDCQYLFNRRKVADLDILESQQQGIILKQGCLVTPDDGMNQGNGRMLTVKKENSLDDVRPWEIKPPSPVMLQMEEMLMNVCYRIAGIDPAAMGIEVDDKAGIVSMMRQVASARNLQTIFDNFDEFQRNCGDILIGMMQSNWTYGKVRQVIGEEPTAEFDNKAFFKYGCKVVQGVLTESQQQLELGQLMHLNEIVSAGGSQPVVNRIIKAMYIQNKDELLEEMAEEAKAKAEQQEKITQLQMQQLQVENETKMAYARSQDGLAQERVAKIQVDKAVAQDKLRRAEHEDTASLLNLVKMLKELKGMDVEHLQTQIETLHRINELEFTPKELEENKESPQNQKTNATSAR